jgi:beta-lactamase class A
MDSMEQPTPALRITPVTKALAPENGRGGDESVDSEGGMRITDPRVTRVAPADIQDINATLLPLAPGVTLDITPTIPRFGPLPTETAPTPALRVTALGRQRGARARWAPYAATASGVVLLAVLVSVLWPVIGAQLNRATTQDQLPALTTSLTNDTRTTSLDPDDAEFGDDSLTIAPEFAAYYTAHNGLETLGTAITPSVPTNLGPAQFFTNGALVYAPDGTANASATNPGDLDPALARNGVTDATLRVVALPLSQELLTLGSKASIGAPDSELTYITLRTDAQPDNFLNAPASTSGVQVIQQPGAPKVLLSSDRAFVVEGKRSSQSVGHAIPLTFWTYINQAAVAPQGWAINIGEPLTEALSVTGAVNGAPHRLQIQAFTQVILIADLDAPTASGAPTITPQAVGADYLRTFGGPTAHVTPGTAVWLTVDGALRTAVNGAAATIGLNANSPVALSGAARWQGSNLWYAINWTAMSGQGQAWVNASHLTTVKPAGIPVDGVNALSTSLASYLAGRGNNIGMYVYDITRGVMYSYNPNGLFIMASSSKVPLMVSYLEWIEGQHRSPNGSEQATMTAMIEHSDNNAAQYIYDTLGDAAGERHYMQGWGITNYTPNPYGWGWASWSPSDMQHVLYLLQSGQVLNASDRTFALYLMNHIESDQQFGVGDSAPNGAQFWMKNGWVVGPDNTWWVNSSGIVKVGNETYIVTVYNGKLGSYQQGVNIVNHVCGAVGEALK